MTAKGDNLKQSLFIVLLASLISSAIFTQDADTINAALSNGDCVILYNYIERGKDNTDSKLFSSATAALRKYISNDSATPKYRTDKMDSRVRTVGKNLMDKIFTEPEATLPDVTAKLITGVNDQFSKAKILHDWICDNISYDVETAFIARINRPQDYLSVLKNKMAVCAGYTNLFNQMCKLANIESIGITGYSKGFGYRGSLGNDTDHAWNAVKFSGKWYLIDVTWDAGHVDQKTYIKNYSTNYLFLDSRSFLYSHLPENDRFQFYAPVLTDDEFITEPYIAGVYFKYGLELKSNIPAYNNIIDNSFSFDIIAHNANVMLTSTVRTLQQKNIEGSAWQGRSGNTINFYFDVPDTQDYKGFIFAKIKNVKKVQERIDINTYESIILPNLDKLLEDKKITEKENELFKNSYFKVTENGYYYFREDQFDTARNNAVLKIHPLLELSLEMLEPVLDFNLKATQGYQGYRSAMPKRFPNTFSAFIDSANTKLVSPIKGELISGTEELFVFESRDYTRFAIILDGQFIFFEKNANGNFELNYSIPSGISELQIFGSKNNKNYNGLIKYNIVN